MYNRRSVFIVACIAIFLFGIGLITLGSVAPMLKAKFHLDEISAGTLFSIMPLGILTGSLLFGPLSDRYGYKILLILSGISMSAGFEGIAYSSSLPILQICVFLFGLGGGAINGATNSLVADISRTKGADLSILGVFFGLGALSMPFMLAILKNILPFWQIVAIVGWITLLGAVFCLLVPFPAPKQSQGFPIAKGLKMLKDTTMILIAFFLFCQSSFEGIINNWTTSYLTEHLSFPVNNALYALSLYLAGMTVIRVLFGTVFRTVPPHKLLFASFAMILPGCVLLKAASSFYLATAGLILFGAGLGGGFPIMLGYVGNRYTDLSGTAFSFVLVVALVGNMLINYLMGTIAEAYGIQHLITVAFAELAVMILLSIQIIRKLKIYPKNQ